MNAIERRECRPQAASISVDRRQRYVSELRVALAHAGRGDDSHRNVGIDAHGLPLPWRDRQAVLKAPFMRHSVTASNAPSSSLINGIIDATGNSLKRVL